MAPADLPALHLTPATLSSPSARHLTHTLFREWSHLTKEWTQVSSFPWGVPPWLEKLSLHRRGPIISAAQLRPRPATQQRKGALSQLGLQFLTHSLSSDQRPLPGRPVRKLTACCVFVSSAC